MMMCNYIKTTEYASYILDFIGSEKYETILASMSYTNPEFKQGFIQGLVWSGLLMNQCKQYVGDAHED